MFRRYFNKQKDITGHAKELSSRVTLHQDMPKKFRTERRFREYFFSAKSALNPYNTEASRSLQKARIAKSCLIVSPPG